MVCKVEDVEVCAWHLTDGCLKGVVEGIFVFRTLFMLEGCWSVVGGMLGVCLGMLFEGVVGGVF